MSLQYPEYFCKKSPTYNQNTPSHDSLTCAIEPYIHVRGSGSILTICRALLQMLEAHITACVLKRESPHWCEQVPYVHPYGVATISRLLIIMVSFAEYRLFCRALLQKRPVILRGLLIVATPYSSISRLLIIMVSFAKEPYERDYILQKRPII